MSEDSILYGEVGAINLNADLSQTENKQEDVQKEEKTNRSTSAECCSESNVRVADSSEVNATTSGQKVEASRSDDTKSDHSSASESDLASINSKENGFVVPEVHQVKFIVGEDLQPLDLEQDVNLVEVRIFI